MIAEVISALGWRPKISVSYLIGNVVM